MKVCIYSRVSTGQQDTTNQSVVLSEWAKHRGFEVIGIYQEEESAWKAGHQRELANLVTDARRRKFQAVLVRALDRLSREGVLLSRELDRSTRRASRIIICLNWLGSQNGKSAQK